MRWVGGAFVALLLIVAGCSAGSDPELVAEPAGTAAPAMASPTTTVAASDVATVVARARDDLVVAYAEPTEEAPMVAELTNPVASGGALVMRVLTPAASVGAEWLHVMLPIRPNGSNGWIRADEVDLSINGYRIEIDTSEHRLDLYEDGVLTLSTEIAVGTGDTPTPYGEFYLAELLEPPDPTGAYGPFAFGLSGFSETLDSFAGGDGVIGIHGTDEPSALGTDVSHGCVRVANEVIEQMAAQVPLGTPVSISV